MTIISNKATAVVQNPLASYKHGHWWTQRVIFATPGTFSFITPLGIIKLRALVWGAGGGAYSTVTLFGAGGGGGGFTEHVWACTPGSTNTLIVGAGSVNNGATSSLSNSTDGVTLSATGGERGANSTPGVGGTGSGGNIITASGGAGGISGTYTACFTGGGAAGSWLGTGGAGGNINVSGETITCSGGGAIGGKAGGASTISYYHGNGAGCGKAAVNITGTDIAFLCPSPGRFPNVIDWFDIYDIGGAGGVGAVKIPTTSFVRAASNGGHGAGGGGGTVDAGWGGILGGGGGSQTQNAGGSSLAAGGAGNCPNGGITGGNGLIIIYM